MGVSSNFIQIKYISLSSITIGIVILILIVTFRYQTYQQLEDMGAIRSLLDLFVYGRTNKKLLYIFTLIGLVLGFISIRKSENYQKYGWLGFSICMVDLLILLTTGS